MRNENDPAAPAALSLCDAIAERIADAFPEIPEGRVLAAVCPVVEPADVSALRVCVFPTGLEREGGTRGLREHVCSVSVAVMESVQGAYGPDAAEVNACAALVEQIAATLDGLRFDDLGATVATASVAVYCDPDWLRDGVFLGVAALRARRFAP